MTISNTYNCQILDIYIVEIVILSWLQNMTTSNIARNNHWLGGMQTIWKICNERDMLALCLWQSCTFEWPNLEEKKNEPATSFTENPIIMSLFNQIKLGLQ